MDSRRAEFPGHAAHHFSLGAIGTAGLGHSIQVHKFQSLKLSLNHYRHRHSHFAYQENLSSPRPRILHVFVASYLEMSQAMRCCGVSSQLAHTVALTASVCGVVGSGFCFDSGFVSAGRRTHQDCGSDGGHRVRCDP